MTPRKTAPAFEKTFETEEVATILRVHVKTVLRLIKPTLVRGKKRPARLYAVNISQGKKRPIWRIPESSLKAFLADKRKL